MALVGYLAPEGLEETLAQELTGVVARYGRLFLAEENKHPVHWVQNIWYFPQTFSFDSISEAAKILRALGPLWALYPHVSLRRAELISALLPFFPKKQRPFPVMLPKVPLGSWTLLDEKTLLTSPQCLSPFPNGEISFAETKIPPSRAYLKLWEFFTLAGSRPLPGDSCLEVGASPGSWTWVLQQLGCSVIAVDRAPLAPQIAALPRVQFFQQDAFSLYAHDFPQVNWVFCDVICYPEKLLQWILPWLSKKVSLVCTVKFQGARDYPFIRHFEQIAGSRLMHLPHNKHELTWSRLL